MNSVADKADVKQLAEQDSAFGLKGVLDVLKRRWPLVMGSGAVLALLSFLVVTQITPRYTGTAAVAVETRKTEVVKFEQVVEQGSPDQATQATQAEILRSPDLLNRVVSSLRLDNDREFLPASLVDGDKPWWSFARVFTRGSPTASKEVPPPSSEAESKLRKALAAENLSRQVTVTPVRNSYVLNISVTSPNAEKAARLANALTDAYIADQIESKYEATRRANSWLEKRVEELRISSVEADKAAETYRISNGLVGGDGGEGSTVAGQQLTEINSQVVSARASRAEKQAQLAQINRLLANGGKGLESSSAILQSSLISSLRQQETEVLRKLSELRSVYGENHPKIINANAEMRDLREKIRLEIQKIAASTANDLAVADAREKALDAGLASATGRSGATKIAQVRYRELQTEAQSAKELYENFLNRYKETTEQLGIQSPDARIIAPAQVPSLPSYPNKPLTIIVGALVGLVAGLIVAIVLEGFDPYVRTVEEAETILRKPILTMIPLAKVSDGELPEETIATHRSGQTAESLVTLKAAIETQLADMPRKVVMITSSIAGEGKTFLAVSHARSLALSGQRVLLIDLDLRRPRVAAACGIEAGPGLAEIFLEDKTVDDLVLTDPISGMDILLGGARQRSPETLLHDERFGPLIHSLRARYDTIMIDTAPIAPISDSQLIGKHVDMIFLAVAWAKAPVAVVKRAVEVLSRIDVPLVGGILTLVDLKRYTSYDRLGYNYYYHRYKSYTYGA